MDVPAPVSLATQLLLSLQKFKVVFRLAHFYDLWKLNYEKMHGESPPV